MTTAKRGALAFLPSRRCAALGLHPQGMDKLPSYGILARNLPGIEALSHRYVMVDFLALQLCVRPYFSPRNFLSPLRSRRLPL